MKVLMINSVCGFGSTGRICTDLSDVLMENGYEVKIAYGRGNAPEKYQKISYRIGNNLGVKLNGAKARLLDNEGFNAVNATRKFLKWADSFNPDILHLHNLHGYYINVKLLFDWIKLRPNMKVLWTLHDCWAFTGHCSHFDYAGCDKWLSGCSACSQRKTYPKSYVFDNCKRNYLNKKSIFTGVKNLKIITPSNWLKSKVEQSFLNEYEVYAINNGLDLSVFKPTESDFREKNGLINKKIILGVAYGWGAKKGLNDFISLSKLISDEYRIVIVGLTDKRINKLPPNVLGIRRTDTIKKLTAIYTSADVFVNPSKEETMGLTTAEALACGTPVIVYNKTAVPEVPDEKSGIVLKENTPKAILDALEKLSFNSADCIARAKTFAKEIKYKEYLSVYNE